MTTRTDRLNALAENGNTPVLIIGGGINGIATFRELALHGVPAVIIDRGDFVSGASAASSHMVHGGIRYLENGEFALVKESVQERNRLVKNAPHLVKPLPTTIPLQHVFAGILSAPMRFLTHKQRTPKARGAILVKIGLVMYDAFAGGGTVVPRHRFRGKKATRELLPDLNPELTYTATYYDAAMASPERLALDVLQDGLDACESARAFNYLEAVGTEGSAVRLRDRLTGREFIVRADVVVNASGPWSDLTNDSLGLETRFMGGTKGSHIVLDNDELYNACNGREIFFENGDGRIVLVYPLAGKVLVGTTDLRVDIAADDIVCTEEEIDYFFDLTKHVFPHIHVDRSQIVFSFSGVRPLPRTEDEAPGFISRDYRIEEATLGTGITSSKLLTLVGGKWTTFRALGEQLSDAVLGLLGQSRSVSTRNLAIGGGRDYPATSAAQQQWKAGNLASFGAARADVLFERYGTRAALVAEYITEALGGANESPDLGVGADLTRAEVAYLVEKEHVAKVSDILYRRTDLAFRGAVTTALVDALVECVGELRGWSAGERGAEEEETLNDLRRARARMTQQESVTSARA